MAEYPIYSKYSANILKAIRVTNLRHIFLKLPPQLLKYVK